MAKGDTLKGRRIPATKDGKIPNWWYNDMQPGDYCGPVTGYTDDKSAVFFLKPNAHDPDAPTDARGMQFVSSPPHVFTEEDDGTLTIRESISEYKSDDKRRQFSDGWHGYLTKGIWEQV